MGIHEPPQMADTFGVPTFYITDVIKEDAGNGNARLWNCELRSGILIPRCEIIIHSANLLTCGQQVTDFAAELFTRQHMRRMGTAH